jgi:hypothetical protein
MVSVCSIIDLFFIPMYVVGGRTCCNWRLWYSSTSMWREIEYSNRCVTYREGVKRDCRMCLNQFDLTERWKRWQRSLHTCVVWSGLQEVPTYTLKGEMRKRMKISEGSNMPSHADSTLLCVLLQLGSAVQWSSSKYLNSYHKHWILYCTGFARFNSAIHQRTTYVLCLM